MRKARLKDLGTFLSGLTYSPDNICEEGEGTLVLRSSNIQDGKLSFADNVFVDCHLPASMHVKPGDILICSRNGSANLVGKTALIDSDINATWGAFMMLFRTVNNSEYMNYLLTASISKYKGLFSTSTINQLTNHMLGNMFVNYCDDLASQQAIANELSSKLSIVDQKISATEELRRKYLYLKSSIINSCFSDTANHDNWQIKRIKEVALMSSGATPKASEDKYYNNGKHPWINTSDVQNCDINQSKYYVTDLALTDYSLKKLPAGTVIMAMYGGGTIGNVGILNFEATTNQACCAMVPKGKYVLSRFLYYYLMSNQESISKQGSGGSQINLSQAIIGRQLISFPSKEIQKEIVSYLDNQCSKINNILTIINKQLSNYKDLKTALISKFINEATHED